MPLNSVLNVSCVSEQRGWEQARVTVVCKRQALKLFLINKALKFISQILQAH